MLERTAGFMYFGGKAGITMKQKINRREFMVRGSAAVLGAGLSLKSGASAPAPSAAESRVIEVVKPGAVREGRIVDPAAVRTMLRRGMAELTGAAKPWAEFLKPTDRVGLKINTLGRPLLFTHHELIAAVVEDLKEFGIRENNIIVWDRYETHMKECKFDFNTGEQGVCTYGTMGLDPGVRRYDPEVGYSSEFDEVRQRAEGSTVSRLSSIFTRECDKVINMAILKDHELAGVTLTLKNLAYGLCDNNQRFHGPKYIGPFIADFCALPIVRKKVVLHMIDGIEACFDQGPAPRNPRVIYAADTLWLGTDPVALDAVGRRVIDEKRKAEGLPSIAETGRPWDHIELAAQKGLGTDDLGKIRVDRIALG
jgi:uncharacterized protein (DUF362 family)